MPPDEVGKPLTGGRWRDGCLLLGASKVSIEVEENGKARAVPAEAWDSLLVVAPSSDPID